MLKCLSDDNTLFLKDNNFQYDYLDSELRGKMAIRAIIQSRIITAEIRDAIVSFQKPNNFIKFTLEEVIKNIKVLDENKNEQEEIRQDLDVDEVDFFSSINKTTIEIVFDDSAEHLKLLMEKHPGKQQQLIVRYILNFLENCSAIDDKFMNDSIKNIQFELTKYNVTIKDNQEEINELMDDIKIDSPKAPKYWKEIIN